MAGQFDMHRSDHRQFVGTLGQVWKQVADRNAALTILPESEWRRKGHTRLPLRLEVLVRQHLACPTREFRFGIERVHLRHAAVEEDMNDPPSGGGEVRDKGRIARPGRLADQICESQRAEAHAAALQEVAP